MEKEIKDKNSLIEKLNSKLDKQHEDIKKLNEKLNVFI
jgi:peptidoglycan hydrolase CwlO-like protein